MSNPVSKARLYVEDDLRSGASFDLSDGQHHYIRSVMRLNPGDAVTLFNGRDGEWLADIVDIAKKRTGIACTDQLRKQEEGPDLWLLFCPLKKEAQDFLVEKAVELGVDLFLPVTSDHTHVNKIREDKVTAHIVEAAEQCERLDLPALRPIQKLAEILRGWPDDRLLLVGMEKGQVTPMSDLLSALPKGQKAALLVGPEGGFSQSELESLHGLPFVRGVGLGPRILRAETAALSMLACWQAFQGDWDDRPAHRF